MSAELHVKRDILVSGKDGSFPRIYDRAIPSFPLPSGKVLTVAHIDLDQLYAMHEDRRDAIVLGNAAIADILRIHQGETHLKGRIAGALQHEYNHVEFQEATLRDATFEDTMRNIFGSYESRQLLAYFSHQLMMQSSTYINVLNRPLSPNTVAVERPGGGVVYADVIAAITELFAYASMAHYISSFPQEASTILLARDIIELVGNSNTLAQEYFVRNNLIGSVQFAADYPVLWQCVSALAENTRTSW